MELTLTCKIARKDPRLPRFLVVPAQRLANVKLSLRRASNELPEQLAALLATNKRAKATWEKMTPSRRRMLSEDVRAAKSAATRLRRAQRGLGI